ncbi:DUF4136 domain-containing protein [Spirosoma areae]
MKTSSGIIILFLASLMACSPYRIVRNQGDSGATWASYQTFAFVDTSRTGMEPSIAYQTAIREVRQAVTAELINRGYQPVTETQPSADLLVNIGAVVNEKTQTRQTSIYEAPRYIGQRRYSWQSQEVPVGTYKEGTLSLHIVDVKRKALIWDAAVSSVLGKKGVTPGQIGEAVSEVFTKFPGKRS